MKQAFLLCIIMFALLIQFGNAQDKWVEINSQDFIDGKVKFFTRGGPITRTPQALTLNNDSTVYLKNFASNEYSLQCDFCTYIPGSNKFKGDSSIGVLFPFRNKLLKWKVCYWNKYCVEGYINGIKGKGLAYKFRKIPKDFFSISLQVKKYKISYSVKYFSNKQMNIANTFTHNENIYICQNTLSNYPFPCIAIRTMGPVKVRNIKIRYKLKTQNKLPKKNRHVGLPKKSK